MKLKRKLRDVKEDTETKIKRLEFMLESSPSIIYTCEAFGAYAATFISENVTKVIGYQPSDFLDNPSFWADHIHPDDKELIFYEMEVLFEKDYQILEYRFQHKDGNYRWMYDELRLIRDADGKPLEMVGSWTDITRRKKAEEELRQRTQGLANLLEVSKGLATTLDMQNILQAAVDGVVELVELDTAATYLLEGEMLHLWASKPPLPREFPDEMRIAPLADHPHIREAITSGGPVFVSDMLTADLTPAERSITEQRNLRTMLFIPLIVDAKAIGVFIVGSVVKPLPISEAKIDLSLTLANLTALTTKNAQLFKETQKHAVQLKQILSDRKLAEKEKTKLEAQLQQAQRMESIGRLAGGVAHDFNNMLTVILGQVELSLLKIDSGNPLRSGLLQIRKAAEHSASLTRQLLAFARKQTIAPKLLDLNDIIGDMLKMLHRLIGEDIDLAWMPGANIGLVKIDPAQVDQILANLCVNARDAILGNGKITIETSKVDFDGVYCAEHPDFIPGSYIMLALSDDGVGMDQKILSQVFEPFFTTKKEGKGTGLGLSTVYGIVKQNNGFINVYSEVRQGTTIKIYLPKYKTDSGERLTKTIDQVVQGGSETIMLVEDELMILDLTRNILESLGYKVLTFNNSTEALNFAREHKGTIDLLITDVVMPEMNGRELAEQIDTIFPDLKTLYISGYTANVIVHHGILRDGVIFLPKPFSKKDLADKVRETLTMKMSD